jgi:tight adherence protein C
VLELGLAILMGGAIALFFVGFGFVRATTPTADSLAERMNTYATRATPLSLEELELQASFLDRGIKPLLQNFSRLVMRFAPDRMLKTAELKLARAGNPNGWNAADFMGVRGLAALICGVVPAIFLFATGRDLWQAIGITAFFVFFGFYMPNVWLDGKIRARQKEIQNALPDALDMMTVCVEAGLGFDAALQKVADKWSNELSRAFERVTQEFRLGRSRREALRDMSDRIDVDDLSAFVAAVLQADQLGVSMSKVLRIQSEQMRVRRRQRAEEQAQKAPIKMLFPMVFLIFPALFVVLLGPAALTLMDTFGV